MTDAKITALTALAAAPAAGDYFVIVDVSDTTMSVNGTNKKITSTYLLTDAVLLAGRAGGQTLYGGTAANEDIIIHGTSHATKTSSYVILQPSGGGVGIGMTPSGYTLDITGTVRVSDTLLAGAVRSGADGGGTSGTMSLSNVSNVAANSSGVGSIKMKGTTNRDSFGFLKIYIGATAFYVPFFLDITG